MKTSTKQHQRLCFVSHITHHTMAPTLEHYDEVSHDLPIKPVATKICGIDAVAAVQLEDSYSVDRLQVSYGHGRHWRGSLQICHEVLA